ncbi:M81 family metallopeptidase [Bradyrhizobium sp. BR 10289]|uniref:M81 family metallopeptidase n=1 Tax=Bradyrhizobium sp. BR 10289 TaxID=2749993 RepID=UPI001C652E3B|nr:M81 family metallopeptidase [Bradyrhizobium sp. BR 10289]
MKVLVAGFKHETNTFAPNLADWRAFDSGEMFPRPARGQAMLDSMASVNVPATGFIRSALSRGWQLLPSLWCGAVPSSYITDQAFDKISDTIVDDARRGDFDAVYLDLHGAAMSQSHDDAEGELIARIRSVVGDEVPIVGSLDLHANVTSRMLSLADGLVSYRTYPHIDYVETGELAAELLARRIQRRSREELKFVRLPFLIPLNAQSTTMDPAKSVYDELLRLEQQHGAMMSFCMGFPASDFEECSPVIWGHGERSALAVERLVACAGKANIWRQQVYGAREGVAAALARTAQSGKPVVIADTQDNPGVGGTGSTTGMLHALLAEGAGRAYPGRVCFGMLFDEKAAAAATAAGVGAQLTLDVGAMIPTWSGLSDPPVSGTFRVRAVGDGRVTFKGPKMTGFVAELGPSACLEIDGVLVAVISAKVGTQDRELFRTLGIVPEEMRLIVVKSSNHFRADFEPLVADKARDVIIAKAAGAMATDPGDLPWKKLPASVRRRP